MERAHAAGVATTILTGKDQQKMRELTNLVWGDWEKKSEMTGKIIASHRAFMAKNGLT